MFQTSVRLLVLHFMSNILVPLIPGILFLWIFRGTKHQGILLYLLGWFVGVGIVAFSLFNLQFLHYGVGIWEYLFIIFVQIVLLIAKIVWKKQSASEYFSTLIIKHIPYRAYKTSYTSSSHIQKYIIWIGGLFVGFFLLTSFVYTISFPSYADDTFGNRNRPALHIYQDGGVHLLGQENEILARGRLGYPIYIPLYKGLIADIVGGYNDIYGHMWQWFVFFGLIMFSFAITRRQTKNIFYSLLPSILICGLPLVFFHSVEGYMDLASAVYALLTVWALWLFVESDYHAWDYFLLSLVFGGILANVKNDGFVIYLAGIFITFLIFLLKQKKMRQFLRGLRTQKNILLGSIITLLFFYVPFLFLKSYYHLGFNQAAGEASGIGLSSQIHREIFSVFPQIFTKMDNYNIILAVLLVVILVVIQKGKSKKMSDYFPLFSSLSIFILFLLVFLATDNYKRVLDQTTVNRVFTMCFVVALFFTGMVLERHDSTTS